MQENPQGIATQTPRFSWQITSDIPDVVQQSYCIQVAETKEDLEKEQNLLWDSGNVDSDLSLIHISHFAIALITVPEDGSR